MALNAILHVAPVNIAGRCLATKVAIKLREAGYILHCFDVIPYCIAKSSPNDSFATQTPPRDLWAGRSNWRRGALLACFLTAESILKGRVA